MNNEKGEKMSLSVSSTTDNQQQQQSLPLSDSISFPRSLDFKDAKKAFALKIAGTLPSGGSSPAKIIHAFIQVRDYEGLDRYLNKHTIAKDVLDFALQKACMASNSDAVSVLTNHGANADFVDQFGTTLLHFAMRGGGNPDVLLTLLNHGMQYQSWRCDGQTLLHWACQWGYLSVVRDLIENRDADIHEHDDAGRLPIHIAAIFGRPDVLKFLIETTAKQLQENYVPIKFMEAINGSVDSDEDKTALGVEISSKNYEQSFRALAKQVAAANYLDNSHRTPLHCACSEEAVNNYSKCMMLLIESGGDPMLQTVQGKTALDLAYEAGRAKVLIDILPTEIMVELLMRINDVVPHSVRQQRQTELERAKSHSKTDNFSHGSHSPNTSRRRSSTFDLTRKSVLSNRPISSVIRRLTDTKETKPDKYKDVKSPESVNLMLVWRKILLNDDIELLETLRDSMIWCQVTPDYMQTKREIRSNLRKNYNQNKRSPADFETSQGLRTSQLAELFYDCYENGTGVFSHIQLNYGFNIKANDFITVLRSLTGLVIFEKLIVDDVVLLSPLHSSILFLSLLCGRFRVAEQLLRMRQFDLIPASVLVVLILHRLYQEPTFPEQVRSELQQFANHVEAIAVDGLTMISLKDNTPEKEICRRMLNVPLRICGNLSLIDLCAQAKCTNLLSLPICQRVLDERWRGVLVHLPNWIGWMSRFCPIFAILHLENKAKHERSKALSEFINEAASYTSTSDATKEKNVFSIILKEVDSWKHGHDSNQRSTLNSHTMPPKVKHLQPNLFFQHKKSPSTKKTRFPLTIYDRLSTEYEWNSSPRLSFLCAIYTSPEVKFFFHSIFHILFLVIFTLVLLSRLKFKIHPVEWGCVAYVIGYGIEECRQMLIEGLRGKFQNYLKDSWNLLEVSAVGFSLVGFWIRSNIISEHMTFRNNTYDSTFYLARVFYLFGLHLFCMRTLFITSISPVIGPRLKMMADMLRKDLIPLLIVFAIFIISYGVSFQGLMYPNAYYRSTLENKTEVMKQFKLGEAAEKLLSRAFYSIFEVSVALEEAECSDKARCGNSVGNKLVILFVLIVYTGIVNLILINLLIALFSNTVSRIGLQSTAHWLADRYQMVKEYQDKSVFPPPLNIISISFELCACLSRLSRCCLCCSKMKKISSQNPISATLDDVESQMCKDEFDVYRKIVHRKWNKKLRNSKRVDKLTKSYKNRFLNGNKEIEAVLQFILVQSFALKDRRYTLGNGNVSSSFNSNAQLLGTSTITIEHRLQILENKLDMWLPAILEEIQKRNVGGNLPENSLHQDSSNVNFRADSNQIPIPKLGTLILHDSGVTTPIEIPSRNETTASTSAVGTQSSFEKSQVFSAITVPRDLLSKRPVSQL